jgi:hypothetical protein
MDRDAHKTFTSVFSVPAPDSTWFGEICQPSLPAGPSEAASRTRPRPLRGSKSRRAHNCSSVPCPRIADHSKAGGSANQAALGSASGRPVGARASREVSGSELPLGAPFPPIPCSLVSYPGRLECCGPRPTPQRVPASSACGKRGLPFFGLGNRPELTR